MIVYHLILRAPGQAAFYGTIKDAQDAGRAHPEIMNNPDQGIQQFDVPIDKAGVLALLNERQVFVTQRSWTFTKRGGLTEVELSNSRVVPQVPLNVVEIPEVKASQEPDEAAFVIYHHVDKAFLNISHPESEWTTLADASRFATREEAEIAMKPWFEDVAVDVVTLAEARTFK